MTDRNIQELEQLNAFIDGELGVEARAEVTARAARDPVYARKLAALSQLKAAVAEAVPTPHIEVPKARARPRGRILAAVAAALVLLVAGGIGWSLLDDGRTVPTGFALENTVRMHRAWAPQSVRDTGNAARPLSAALRPSVPDLSANGLDLAYVGARKTAGGKDMLLIGYLGSRGCRVTMFVNEAESSAPDKVVMIETDDMLASLWRAGPLSYALLAEGMARPRFQLIADSVREASLRRLPLDDATRMALSRNRAASRPCRA